VTILYKFIWWKEWWKCGEVWIPLNNDNQSNTEPPSITYDNCIAPQTIWNYTITENKNHNETLISTRTGALSDWNWNSNYKQQFKCNDGTFEEDWEGKEEQPPTCNENYEWENCETPSIRNQDCTWKPDNSVYNTATGIIQTWD
jgi:hypothetical protein